MRKLIALMLVFSFLFGCATTVIKSKPSGAEVYKGEKLLGKTPYTFTSAGIARSKTIVTLKMDGYKDNAGEIIKNHTDVLMIVLGCFSLVPLLWWADFPPEYTFEMEKIVTVNWPFENIREGPGMDYSVVATVKQGDKLTVIGESGEWLNVRLENGQEGWISNRVVK